MSKKSETTMSDDPKAWRADGFTKAERAAARDMGPTGEHRMELYKYGSLHPDFMAHAVEKLAQHLTAGHASQSTETQYQGLVCGCPENVDYLRVRFGKPTPPAPISRGERLAAAWAEVEARNGGERRG